MTLADRVEALPVTIEGLAFVQHHEPVSSGFERVTTIFQPSGLGVTGAGEDVSYGTDDHAALVEVFETLDLNGNGTVGEISRRLDDIAAFNVGYRRWGIESALVDLALRQAGATLGDVLGLRYRPIRFVVSTRLDAREWLRHMPAMEFKLDATPDWSAGYLADLAATGAVRCLDLKAHYHDTAVDNPPDAALYRACVELFPGAVIEDAATDPGSLALLADALDRLSFDAPIHSIADVEALPVAIAHLNIKPSRFGTWRRLLDCIEWALARDIALYGGGQFELGVGREHIQAIASLFYADAANDVAPRVFNVGEPRGGLPTSPLPAPTPAAGIG